MASVNHYKQVLLYAAITPNGPRSARFGSRKCIFPLIPAMQRNRTDCDRRRDWRRKSSLKVGEMVWVKLAKDGLGSQARLDPALTRRPCKQRLVLGLCGGAGGIRTHDRGLPYTHFPGVRLRPLGHRSACLIGRGAHLAGEHPLRKQSKRACCRAPGAVIPAS